MTGSLERVLLWALLVAGVNVALTGAGFRVSARFPRSSAWVQAVGTLARIVLIFGAALALWPGVAAGVAFILITTVLQTAGQVFLVLKDQRKG